MIVRVEGIVLRSTDYGEGNKILTVFSREAGKISMMARGAKMVKSRFTALALPFTYGEFVLYKTGQMGTLNSGEIWNGYQPLRESIHDMAYAAYLMELTEKLLADQEPCEPIFEQLKAALDALVERKDSQIIMHIYELRMLAFAGYRPELEQCVSCGERERLAAFSASRGGVVCARCRGADSSAAAIGGGTLKLLRLLGRLDIRRLGTIDVKPQTKAELQSCIRMLMDTHLDIRWKSRKFIDQMSKYEL